MDIDDTRPLSQASSPQSPTTPVTPASAGKKPASAKSERDKRTYRACLHCRQRKSRCDLYSSGEPGKPPCERCIREQHECVLGGSRRGGRRIKRTASDPAGPVPTLHHIPSLDSARGPEQFPLSRNEIPTSYHSQSATPRLPSWNTLNPESRILPPLAHDGSATPSAKLTVDDQVAAADLQNPADALEFLAHVAERDSGGPQLAPMHSTVYNRSPHPMPHVDNNISREPDRASHAASHLNVINYPPLIKGHLTLEMLHILLNRYDEKYHPFFPLANPAALDANNLPTSAAKEPHLLSAILTVASKDEKDWWQIHEACSAHMQTLVASLVYTGVGSVEAVEAMLILAEWVPRRPQSIPAIGRGEEDQAAWMYVGTAIRLGYLLGIDRSGFRVDDETQSAELNRRRLAWASCYMSDRQISVRIGKAFWSRGPGPMTALRAHDFPSLQPRLHRQDNLAGIFQASLELTQLFSNAHDVLYATKSRSNQLNAGGEYVKYIDDFRVALRHWHETWGVFTCSPALKASLILQYEYLRLYVNAFAYQATLNRLIGQFQAASSNGSKIRPPAQPFADIAATPDARFIYDSIDAAKSLLSTFCSFVDPQETFRFMPLRYYLYVIYSAVFLYKARSTGVMTGDKGKNIKRLISDTLDNLQKSSACANDIGDRYSRLIRLLWRKPPGRGGRNSIADPGEPAIMAGGPGGPIGPGTGPAAMPLEAPPPSINAFSWLDLNAVGDFAVENNNSVSGSLMDGLDNFDDSSADGFSQMGYDTNLIPPQFWHDLSPSEVVF